MRNPVPGEDQRRQRGPSVYRDPWFLKVRRNTKTKHVRRGPRILSDEDTEEFMAHQKKVLESRRKFNEGKQQQEKDEELASDGGAPIVREPWYPNIVAFLDISTTHTHSPEPYILLKNT